MKTEVTKMKGPIGGGDLGTTTPEGSAHANDIQINMRCPGYPRISGNSTNNQLTLDRTRGRRTCCLFPPSAIYMPRQEEQGSPVT